MWFIVLHTHGALKLSCSIKAESKEAAKNEFWRQDRLFWGEESSRTRTKLSEIREES